MLQVHPSGQVANASIELQMLLFEFFHPRKDALLPRHHRKLCTAELSDGLFAPQWDPGREFPYYKTVSWIRPIRSLQAVADLKFKVHDHTTQVFPNGFCLFLTRHLVIAACRLGVHCGEPLVAYSHVIGHKALQYPYSAIVRMNCDYGYERAEGSYALRCLANGQWNDTSLRCKRKWSSGVRYHLVECCVCFFFFLDKI